MGGVLIPEFLAVGGSTEVIVEADGGDEDPGEECQESVGE